MKDKKEVKESWKTILEKSGLRVSTHQHNSGKGINNRNFTRKKKEV